MTLRATFDTYETILSAYDYFNPALFGGQLPEVIITYHHMPNLLPRDGSYLAGSFWQTWTAWIPQY